MSGRTTGREAGRNKLAAASRDQQVRRSPFCHPETPLSLPPLATRHPEARMQPGGQRSLTERMKGAALLQIDVYEEVEADADATKQAAVVVGIAALAAAIGGVDAGAGGFLSGIIATYLGWLLWSGLTYLIGDKLLGGTATWGELLRTLGFAQTPRVLLLLAIIPLVGWLVRLV